MSKPWQVILRDVSGLLPPKKGLTKLRECVQRTTGADPRGTAADESSGDSGDEAGSRDVRNVVIELNFGGEVYRSSAFDALGGCCSIGEKFSISQPPVGKPVLVRAIKIRRFRREKIIGETQINGISHGNYEMVLFHHGRAQGTLRISFVDRNMLLRSSGTRKALLTRLYEADGPGGMPAASRGLPPVASGFTSSHLPSGSYAAAYPLSPSAPSQEGLPVPIQSMIAYDESMRGSQSSSHIGTAHFVGPSFPVDSASHDAVGAMQLERASHEQLVARQAPSLACTDETCDAVRSSVFGYGKVNGQSNHRNEGNRSPSGASLPSTWHGEHPTEETGPQDGGITVGVGRINAHPSNPVRGNHSKEGSALPSKRIPQSAIRRLSPHGATGQWTSIGPMQSDGSMRASATVEGRYAQVPPANVAPQAHEALESRAGINGRAVAGSHTRASGYGYPRQSEDNRAVAHTDTPASPIHKQPLDSIRRLSSGVSRLTSEASSGVGTAQGATSSRAHHHGASLLAPFASSNGTQVPQKSVPSQVPRYVQPVSLRQPGRADMGAPPCAELSSPFASGTSSSLSGTSAIERRWGNGVWRAAEATAPQASSHTVVPSGRFIRPMPATTLSNASEIEKRWGKDVWRSSASPESVATSAAPSAVSTARENGTSSRTPRTVFKPPNTADDMVAMREKIWRKADRDWHPAAQSGPQETTQARPIAQAQVSAAAAARSAPPRETRERGFGEKILERLGAGATTCCGIGTKS